MILLSHPLLQKNNSPFPPERERSNQKERISRKKEPCIPKPEDHPKLVNPSGKMTDWKECPLIRRQEPSFQVEYFFYKITKMGCILKYF
ncbi:hypothetical protein [Methanosphaerula palustris]|uniref:hypothetical protein n=1 Tax=Methanosphaerula palustris TaxID=475088 RepID=UPI0011D14F05|nr:hypothetical protein [Methanosphaerula palustris]